LTTEQREAVSTEQQEVTAGQESPVTAPVDAAVAAATADAVADLDLSTPDGVRAAAKRFKAIQDVLDESRLNGENTGKQRTLSEMRREQGTADRAKAYHDDLIRRINAGENFETLTKQTPLYVKANEDWTRVEIMRGLIAQARTLDEEAVAPLAELAEALEGNAEEIQKVAQAALNAVANKSGATARQSILDAESLDAVPKDSKLYKAIRAEIEKETETEVNAQKTEAKPVPAGPKTPVGTATNPMTRQTFEALSRDDQKAYVGTLSEAQRDELWATVTAS